MHALQALLDICDVTYQGCVVAWFGGDDDDAPGWRAFALCGSAGLVCVGAPPRLGKYEALQDMRFVSWRLDSRGIAWPSYSPPEGWPGRRYGVTPEECGPDSLFGVDVSEDAAEDWVKLVRYCYGLQ
jgi:hypothetical protein